MLSDFITLLKYLLKLENSIKWNFEVKQVVKIAENYFIEFPEATIKFMAATNDIIDEFFISSHI